MNLEYIKRLAGVIKKKIFGFHEEDTLLYNPVLYIISLAFADNVFLNGFTDPI